MRLDDTNVAPDAADPGGTVVEVIDGHPVYDDGHGSLHMDRDDISGADAIRAAVIDAYEQRPPVTVRHVLLVQCERDWYGQTEDIVEIADTYLDQEGDVLGGHSDCWWVTWVVGADCLAVISRRGRTRVTGGGEAVPSDTLLGVLCPRCGDAIGVDTMLAHDQANVLRCRRCGLEVETESIAARTSDGSIRTGDVRIGWLPRVERVIEAPPQRVRPRVLEW